MKSVRCYLVRLKELVSISDKAFKAVAHDGTTAILPKSQVIMPSLQHENGYWISCWIMDQKELQHSKKTVAWVNPGTFKVKYEVITEHHVPVTIAPTNNNPDESLIR